MIYATPNQLLVSPFISIIIIIISTHAYLMCLYSSVIYADVCLHIQNVPSEAKSFYLLLTKVGDEHFNSKGTQLYDSSCTYVWSRWYTL